MNNKIIRWTGHQPELSSHMTLRDYFAAAALQSVLKSCGDLNCYYEQCAGSKGDNYIPIPSSVAAYCFELADAMLAERAKKRD